MWKVNLALWSFLLGIHLMIGLTMRGRMKPSAVFKMTRRNSLLAGLVMLPLVLVSIHNWGWLVVIVLGPWVSALVATFPSPKKRMGLPLSSTMRFAQEAISVVQIGHATGNGFWISPNRLVTCLHILAGDIGGRLLAHTISGPVELSLTDVSAGNDLIVFDVAEPRSPAGFLKLATSTKDLKPGDRVIHACYSNPSWREPQWREADGTIQLKGEINLEDVILLDLKTESGDSGSPVMNEHHEVIGIVVAGSSDAQTTLITSVESIHRLLQSQPDRASR